MIIMDTDDILLKIILPVLVVVCIIVCLVLACLCCKKKREYLIKSCAQPSTDEIEKRITDKINRDMCRKCFCFNKKSWSHAVDNGRRPVIVFCVISSRIGTDIENAMRGVHANSRVVLVLLHCVLPSV